MANFVRYIATSTNGARDDHITDVSGIKISRFAMYDDEQLSSILPDTFPKLVGYRIYLFTNDPRIDFSAV